MRKKRSRASLQSRRDRVGESAAPAYGALGPLLDTHVWLWWQRNDRRLGRRARAAITDAPRVWVSVASIWEVMIKASLGKLEIPRELDMSAELDRFGFEALPIDIAHVQRTRDLPRLHRDPFDRLLVAQASHEGLVVITDDDVFSRYGVSVLSATD